MLTCTLPIGIIQDMQTLHSFISTVEEYCRGKGISPATLCGYATGNPRLLERLRRRADKIDEDMGKLEKHMAEHPVRPSAEAV